MNPTANNSLFYMLHDATRQLRKHFDRRATRLELTRAQWRALKATSRQEGLSQTELAELLDMEPIPVGRVIDRLEKTGFVERRADPADRRVWRLYLLPPSTRVTDEVERLAVSLRREATAGITAAELATTLSVLQRVRGNLIQLDREGRGEPSNKS